MPGDFKNFRRQVRLIALAKKPAPQTGLVSLEFIERRIVLICGHKVMLDVHLAELYQVETKNLNQAVRRHADRFPEDFMFQLSVEEADSLRAQIVTSNAGRGGRRYLPYAFAAPGAEEGRDGVCAHRPK